MAQGISNRETPDEEEWERKEHPPGEASGSSVDMTAQADDESIDGDRQTSSKAGSRSLGQKEDASKYADRQMPAAAKVDGAFGKEEG